ncbi:MAG TPA: SHOCT domain-containing protein [Acidimicrobiia bacterium]|jgi:hypothetical protein
MPWRDFQDLAVGALLDARALARFARCLDALADLVGDNALLAVVQVHGAGAEGILALTVDELLFAAEHDADITGEPLADVRTCFVNPDSRTEIVMTLNDGSVLEFDLRGSPEDAHWFASSIWSSALPPPPAAAPAPSPVRSRLTELKELHDSGLITSEDYELRRRAILEEL